MLVSFLFGTLTRRVHVRHNPYMCSERYENNMRIAFIHPTMRFREGGLVNSFYQSAVLPLWAPILSALTPQEHERRYISGQPRQLREKDLEGFDLVALSVIPATASDGYRIGDMCREMGIKCLMGGYLS